MIDSKGKTAKVCVKFSLEGTGRDNVASLCLSCRMMKPIYSLENTLKILNPTQNASTDPVPSIEVR